MSGMNDIPWNMKPKNGLKTFFTEETFNKWLGQETHESRLEERLTKIGISPPPRLTAPIFLSKSKPAEEITGTNKNATKIVTHTKGQRSTTETNSGKRMIRSKLEVKKELPAQQSESEFPTSPTQVTGLNTDIGEAKHSIENIESLDAVHYIQHSSENVVNKAGAMQNRNDSVGQKERPCIYMKEEDVAEATRVDDELNDRATDTVKPFSFYKEGTEEELTIEAEKEKTEEEETAIAMNNDVESITIARQKDTISCDNETENGTNFNRRLSKAREGVEEDATKLGETEHTEAEMSEEARKEYEAKKQKEARKAQKELMMQDKMFFNLKDRQAEKYFPEIFKKKPRNRWSKLTCQEQKLYIDLARCYGNLSADSQAIHDENFKKYIAMKVTVSKEQELFQNYLKSISHACKKDYEFIHPEVEKYAATRYLAKRRECFKYPQFYSNVDKIVLTHEMPDTPPTLQYVRPLLELGSVSKLVLPNIVPGMPQPCVTTSFKKINDICPIFKGVYKGTYVWNKVPCSQDANAEQIAVPNKCDVVMPSSAVRRLIDNQGKIFKYWDMPFTVREYQLNEGGKTTLHKVIYIDKPLIRQSQYIHKDQIQLYQKHAIRACAIRTNVRGHVFCGIKPVHELVKWPTIEEVQQEVKLYEEKLKEMLNPDTLLDDENDDDVSGKTDLRKRNRKQGQVGMFDLEKEIDDLETFGMDSFIGSKVKGDGNKSSPDEKTKISSEKKETPGNTVKKGRKSADDDLEFLRNELKGIKSQAFKESFKHPEMYKDTYSKENKKEGQDSENTKIEGTDQEKSDSSSNIEDKEETMLKHDEAEENDIESESQKDKDTTGSSSKDPRTARKTKKDLLSVKNMTSLSERMKQMTSIKSKLMQRTHGLDSVQQDQAPSAAGQSRKRTQSVDNSTNSLGVNSNSLLMQPDETNNETKLQQKLIENTYDSDSEGEGLVIDVPTESPVKSARNDELKSPEMPTLEKISDGTPCKVTIKDENQTISSESEFDSPHLIIAVEEPEEANEKPKGTKRRSTSDIPENVPVPKRVLRSASSQKSAGLKTDVQGKSHRLENRQPESEGNNLSGELDKIAVTRGRKREHDFVSTRSRSASTESGVLEPGTSSLVKGRRVTRRSLGSINVEPTKEEQDIDPVPAKRGRGRRKKNEPKSDKNEPKSDKNEPKSDKTEIKDEQMITEETVDSVLEKQVPAKTEDKVNIAFKVGELEEDENVNAEIDYLDGSEKKSGSKDADSDNEEEIQRKRNKTSVRLLDSDESEEHSRDGHEEVHRGKSASVTKKNQSKKDLSDLEARKIKEMAEAMKKRIAEAKNKIQAENKIKESTVSESGKLDRGERNLPKVSDRPDKTTNAADTIVKLKQGNSNTDSTGLDKGLENILKLQDQMCGSGSGPDPKKGSLAEVFTQKHGMTHCGFPVDDNVTYHQWNLSGVSVIIRCKYHGFISGQGLVHISPKIEYQPNFGFEQDTVNETCKNWISIYVRPNSTLLKPRINPFNSEIMMFENVAYKDLVPPDSLFKPEQAFTDLHVILEKLKSLPVGQYLLKNNPRKDQFTVMKAGEQGGFDLHLNNSSIIKCNSPPSTQWTPLDTTLMLQHQRKMNFIPCTFQPKDAKVGEKKPQKSKKRKRKRNNKNTDS